MPVNLGGEEGESNKLKSGGNGAEPNW